MDLTIAIVSYNTKDALRQCLRSYAAASMGLKVQTIVVDNASADGSPDMVRATFPDVVLVANRVNLYYGAALNQALDLSRGRYFVASNADIQVGADALREVVWFLRTRPEAAALTCLVQEQGAVVGPWRFRSFGGALMARSVLARWAARSHANSQRGQQVDDAYRVDVIGGAFMVFRRDALLAIGGFDPRIKLYFTEDDVCRRLHARGFNRYCLQRPLVGHIEGGSLSTRPVRWLTIRSIDVSDAIVYFRKHGTRLERLLAPIAFQLNHLFYTVPLHYLRTIRSRLRRSRLDR